MPTIKETRSEFQAASKEKRPPLERAFLRFASRAQVILEQAARAASAPANTWFQAASAIIPNFQDFMQLCVNTGRVSNEIRDILSRNHDELERVVAGRTAQVTVPERLSYFELVGESLGLDGMRFGVVIMGDGPGFMGAALAKRYPGATVVNVEPSPVDLFDPLMLRFALGSTTAENRRAYETAELRLTDVPPVIEGSGRDGAERALQMLTDDLDLPVGTPVIFLNSWTVQYWKPGQSGDLDALVDSRPEFARAEIEPVAATQLNEREQKRIALALVGIPSLKAHLDSPAGILAVTLRLSGWEEPIALGFGDNFAMDVRRMPTDAEIADVEGMTVLDVAENSDEILEHPFGAVAGAHRVRQRLQMEPPGTGSTERSAERATPDRGTPRPGPRLGE